MDDPFKQPLYDPSKPRPEPEPPDPFTAPFDPGPNDPFTQPEPPDPYAPPSDPDEIIEIPIPS